MQSQVLTVASSLASRGHRVTVAVGGGGVSPADGVEFISLPAYSPRTIVSFVLALRRVARQHHVDVVHAHGLRLAPTLRLIPAARRFVTCHGIDPENAARAARSARLSRVAIISCGQGPQRLLERYGVRSEVIYNAFTPSAVAHSREEMLSEFDLASDVALVVLPARYSRQKAHDRLIEALRLVREQMGDRSPEVVCFGDGPLRDATADSAERLDARPLARILEYRADASAWLGATDFFILPSRWEGQPLVVLEALSHSLAVVTLTDGIEDLIVDGRNGRLVHSVGQLASVIEQWSQTPSSRLRDDALNEQILNEHSLAVVTNQYEALYERTQH